MASPARKKQQGPGNHFEHKVAVLLIFILGFGGLILGIRYVDKDLHLPFYNVLYYEGEDTYLTSDEEEAEEIKQQKASDTDEDELSDYDELYIYKTSPYLADSDSDGYGDKQEIFSGNDPNCPTGTDCGFYFASADEAGPGVSADELIGGVPNSGIASPTADFESEEDVLDFLKQMSVEQIRQTLVEAGASEELINSMDDETLIEVFNEALGEAELTP